MNKRLLDLLPLIFFAALFLLSAVVIFSGLDRKPAPPVAATAPEPMPVFAIEGLSNESIKGPALVNVFASWCLPCKAEHPVITDLARNYRVYGIAFMDAPDNLERFLEELGNPYTSIGHDIDGIAGSIWAVRGVPTTFVINDSGQIIYRHDAPLTPANATHLREILKAAS